MAERQRQAGAAAAAAQSQQQQQQQQHVDDDNSHDAAAAADSTSTAAALIYFHGGGYTVGSIDEFENGLRVIAERAGIVIFAVEYRLAPEWQFPIQLDEYSAVLDWVCGIGGRERGIHPHRVCCGGDSAGGNMTAAFCLIKRDHCQLVNMDVDDPNRKLFLDHLDRNQNRNRNQGDGDGDGDGGVGFNFKKMVQMDSRDLGQLQDADADGDGYGHGTIKAQILIYPEARPPFDTG